MARRRDKTAERRTAAGRVQRLMQQAREEALGPDADLADRYARMARRVATRYQLAFSPEQKTATCRACGAYLVPGRTSRTRLRRHRVATTCLGCGNVRRVPLEARA